VIAVPDRREEELFESLLEGSSLGEAGARALRRRTSDEQVERVRRMMVDLEALERASSYLDEALRVFDALNRRRVIAARPWPVGAGQSETEGQFARAIFELHTDVADCARRLRDTRQIYAATESSLSVDLMQELKAGADPSRGRTGATNPPAEPSAPSYTGAARPTDSERDLEPSLELITSLLRAARDTLEEGWSGEAAQAALGRFASLVGKAVRLQNGSYNTPGDEHTAASEELLLPDAGFAPVAGGFPVASAYAKATDADGNPLHTTHDSDQDRQKASDGDEAGQHTADAGQAPKPSPTGE
jgi:hypothetical protein